MTGTVQVELPEVTADEVTARVSKGSMYSGSVRPKLTRAGGGHDSDSLGSDRRRGGDGRGSRDDAGAGLARSSSLARPVTTTPLAPPGATLGLHDTGEGRAGGKSQKSNRLKHFREVERYSLEAN